MFNMFFYLIFLKNLNLSGFNVFLHIHNIICDIVTRILHKSVILQ